MTLDLQNAKELLSDGGYTCVICRRDEVYVDTQRGVKPLLDLLDHGVRLSGFSAADKVIGRATAFLYVLLGVSNVYTPVISTAAKDVLERYGVGVYFDLEVDFIENRSKTGQCPMEDAVRGITRPDEALRAIRRKYEALNK